MIFDRPTNGSYIGFEGVSGVGKTYYTQILADHTDVTLIPEAPRSGLGRNIFQVLAENDDEFFRYGYPTAEALTIYGIKQYSVQKTVIPHLEAGKTVIQIRPFYSTSMYASILESERSQRSVIDCFEEFNSVRSMLSFAPDVNIYLYDSFDACLNRIQRREDRTFPPDEVRIMNEMHSLYDTLVNQYSEDFYKLSIKEKTDEEVITEIIGIIREISSSV